MRNLKLLDRKGTLSTKHPSLQGEVSLFYLRSTSLETLNMLQQLFPVSINK